MTEPGYTAPDLALFGDDHVRQYLETGGAVGHDWNGVPALVLTTTGRRSGEPRRSAMIYGRATISGQAAISGQGRDAYVVIASQGGAPTHPNWYLNLVADPNVEVDVGPDRLVARARTAEGDERSRLWALMAGVWPNFDIYRTRTERQIPVVVLEPVR